MITRFARINPALLYKKKVVIPVNKLICVLMMKLNSKEMPKDPHVAGFAWQFNRKNKSDNQHSWNREEEKTKNPFPKSLHRFHP